MTVTIPSHERGINRKYFDSGSKGRLLFKKYGVQIQKTTFKTEEDFMKVFPSSTMYYGSSLLLENMQILRQSRESNDSKGSADSEETKIEQGLIQEL